MKIKSTLLFGLFVSTSLLNAQNDESKVYKQYSINQFVEILKPFQTGDYAVGIQSKGKLANVITNFGELSSFHIYAPSLEWPAFGEGQKDQQQYGWGVDLLMGYKGDVIESFKDPASGIIGRDWQPSLENLFSGNVTVSETDLTPFMATSDNKDTWPIGNGGNPFWPGLFRQDTLGNIFSGEFTSERDLFCVYTDEGNNTPYGIRVEQTAYSFSRRYAEDFLVYRFNIKNTSGARLDSLYPGMLNQFLIDFNKENDSPDLIDYIDTNNDGVKDLIYMWDEDGIPQDPWIKVGYIGLLVVETPKNNGITNFHFFHDDFIPSKDEDFWMILSSDTTGVPDTTKARYFHGDDVHIDDVSFAPGLDPDGNNRGGKISWGFSNGPISLAAGDSMQLEIAIVCGDDKQDLLENVEWVWFLKNNAWNGSNPPRPPLVDAFSGDGKIIVTWDDTSSENSRDNINGNKDFEGYKVYRSEDQGKSWGNIITDSRGDFVAFKPLAQFDLKNEIYGFDPISNQYLGKNSGLKHTFVDSSVDNGVEYWYSVTAYDHGDSINQVESLESSIGLTTDETNIDGVTPKTLPANYLSASFPDESTLLPDSGITDGKVFLEIVDQRLIKTRNYKITFQEDTPIIEGVDTVDLVTTFTLKDIDTDTVLLLNHLLTDDSGDNLPVIDGFQLKVTDAESGVSFMGWTKVAGDTCTFDWRTKSKYPELVSSGQAIGETIETFDDWRITVDYTNGIDALWYDVFFGTINSQSQHLPIRVEVITDPANPIDLSEYTYLAEFSHGLTDTTIRDGFYSRLGWDLVPGGLGYLSGSPSWYEKHVDILILEKIDIDSTSGDTIPNYLYLLTNNKPDTSFNRNSEEEIINAHAPSDGDEFTIFINKTFTENIVYTFSTTAGSFINTTKEDLKKIKVVPNPYFVTSALDDRVMFTHLPNQCDIKIFTVAGDLVKTLNHSDDLGIEYWDMKNDEGLEIAYGLYVYVVKTRDGKKHVGKFSVIR